jgi:hypothetical protein
MPRREERGKMTREEAGRKGVEAKAKAEEVPGLKDVDTVEMHIIDIKYPASKEDIINAFEEFDDVDPSDKEWVSKHLQDGTYKNDDEVIHAMGLKYTLTATGHKGGEARGTRTRATEEAG